MSMAGHIVLAGGAEFCGQMVNADLRMLELAGGRDVPISIIPTASAPGQRHMEVGAHGRRWFRTLGARNIEVLPIVDRVSANDSVFAERLRASRIIYLVSGFMGYLHRTLKGSACWEAVQEAYQLGAVIGGSSAGAMVLGQYFYDPAIRRIADGFNLVSNTCVLPHHDVFGYGWVERLTQAMPHITVVGIDESTAMIDDGDTHCLRNWNIYGGGAVTCYRLGSARVYNEGQRMLDSFTEQV